MPINIFKQHMTGIKLFHIKEMKWCNISETHRKNNLNGNKIFRQAKTKMNKIELNGQKRTKGNSFAPINNRQQIKEYAAMQKKR